MARKIRGMTIELSADVSKYQKAMKDAYKTANHLENRMKDINSLLKNRPNDQGLYNQAFSTLSKQIENSKKQLESLNKVYKIAEDDFKKGRIGQDELNHLQRDIKATESEIKKFTKALENIKIKASSFEELRAKISKVDDSLKKNKNLLKEVNSALKLDPKNIGLVKNQQDLLSSSIYDTKKKLDLCRQAQEELVKEFNKGTYSKDEYTERYAKLRTEIIKAKEEIRQLAKESDITKIKLEKMGESFSKVGNSVKNAGQFLTTRVSLPITGALTLATKETMALESAMAGVNKTTDLTDKELNDMKNTFIEMSRTTPVTAKELANIGEMAGQLSIKKENIAEFSKTISDLTIATNLTKEQGSMDLARFMAITQMSQDEVSNLGSSLVALGNNFATTEDEILQMGLRLAAQGEIVGLTESQTMGLAAALSTVGLKSEQGGSSFSRVMLKMNTAVLSTEERMAGLNNMLSGTEYTINDVTNAINQGGSEGKQALDTIGAAIGMTGEDLKELASDAQNGSEKLEVLGKVSGLGADGFAKAWREDPMKAIEAFIGGLKKMKDSNKDLNTVFEALDMSSIREVDTLQRLAGANSELGRAVETSTKAYEENTALQHEVEIFNQTTANQLKMLKNEAIALGIKVGEKLTPAIKDVTSWLKDLTHKVSQMDDTKVEKFVKALLGVAAVGPLLSVAGSLIGKLGSIALFASKVSGELAVLKTGMEVSTTGAGLFAKGLTGLGTLLAPPGGFVIAGVLALVVGLKKLDDKMSESCIQSDVFGDEVSEGTKKAVGGFLELDEEATKSLNNLKASGEVVSEETVASITNAFGSMGSQISSKIEENKSQAVDSLTRMYEDMGTATDQANIDTIDKVIKTYDSMSQRTQEGQNRIKEILETAKEEKRVLTEQEQIEIGNIQNQMKDDGIRILSESEQEYAIIRQRMKDQSGIISTEQASQLVQDSVKVRDETVANAEEEYNERIRQAELLRADGTEESKMLADKILEDSKKVRDDTIKDAEERHQKIVDEAKKQASEHVDEVNWETGEILTGWELFRVNMGKRWDDIITTVDTKGAALWESVKRGTKDGWEAVKRHTRDTWEGIKNHVNGKIESIKTLASLGFEFVRSTAERKWEATKEAIVSPIRHAKEIIEGIVERIKGMMDFELPMPRIPSPHIQWQEISVLNKTFSIPWDISWYKKGGIFTKPTLFNTPYGMKGVGEAGAEAVLPIEKLDGIVANALIKAGNTGDGGITITGNTFNVRNDNDIEKVARELYTLIERKKRGVGIG